MASRLTAYIVVLIVAGTLIAGLIVGAQRDDLSGPVEIIVTNGRVYTPDGLEEALAIRGNKILRVGSNREIKRLRRPQTLAIDAHGAAVLPGFNDAHAHTLSAARSHATLDLSDADSYREVQRQVRAYAAAHPNREWIRGRGWTDESFGGAPPTRQMLDALVPDRPAWLIAEDGRTGWANSRALAEAGITRQSEAPANGRIARDRSGEPTGALEEDAMALVERVLPETSRADELAALRDAIAHAHRMGVTSVQNAGGSAEDLALFDSLREEGGLDLRVYQALSAGPEFTDADADRLDALRVEYPDDPLLKAGAVELRLGGTGDDAGLESPAGRGATTEPTFTLEELTRVVSLLDGRGWQVMIHAPGERAVRMALDAFEYAANVNPAPPQGRRHRIEHIEAIDPEDITRFAELGVIASLQPYDGDSWEPDAWLAYPEPERAGSAGLYETLRRAGATVVFGSDWPAASLDPRFGLLAATARTSPAGALGEADPLDERMALNDAIDAYSAAGAFASFDDQRKGTIEPGMLADVVVLSGDIFSPDRAVIDTEVTVTIFDGRVVYARDEDELRLTE